MISINSKFSKFEKCKSIGDYRRRIDGCTLNLMAFNWIIC